MLVCAKDPFHFFETSDYRLPEYLNYAFIKKVLFEINTNGNTIVTYATEKEKYTSQPKNVSAGGGILSGGNQVLFILQIEPNNSEFCIQDIIVADLNGNALNSISLDCIRPKIPWA